ncbi:MAG: tagaturonate reductase, partial [Terriglobia bacterium]
MGSDQLPLLSRKQLESLERETTAGAELPPRSLMSAPETILQFGTGNFLRGFVEDFVQLANRSGDLSGRVVAVQRRPDHRSAAFTKQDGLYTLILRGIEAGRKVEVKRVIASVSRLLISETHWDQVMSVAANPMTSVILSNVTETGLALDPSDRPGLMPPRGFPGKLTQLLVARWQGASGRDADVAVIPCELVENNGPLVRRLVLDQAQAWNIAGEFTNWVETSVHFASTLVDRIVVGTPRPELLQSEWEALGYRDEMIDCAEPFYLFALEADSFT